MMQPSLNAQNRFNVQANKHSAQIKELFLRDLSFSSCAILNKDQMLKEFTHN